MNKCRSTAEQIIFALRQAESGTPVVEFCRKLGVTKRTVLGAGQLDASRRSV